MPWCESGRPTETNVAGRKARVTSEIVFMAALSSAEALPMLTVAFASRCATRLNACVRVS